MAQHPSHTWRFFRAGGFDQVRIDTVADLLSIGELDQKLWMALSCPVKGIEFDTRTLSLIDTDQDGHIRPPELIAAVEWAASHLIDHSALLMGHQGLPLAAIAKDQPASTPIYQAGQLLAQQAGLTEDARITVEMASSGLAVHLEEAMSRWAHEGGAYQVLGEQTEAAWQAMSAVSAKIDDFFVRCKLAAYQASASEAFNASADDFRALAGLSLQTDQSELLRLPMARIDAHASLPLLEGCNPAWADLLAAFNATVVSPLLGERTHLSYPEWLDITAKLAPYGQWLMSKPDPATMGDGVRDLEKLVRYARDLLPLANNFVAFKDFYTRQGQATFQLGTLYLDGRSCELCVAADDVTRHASLASLSRMCLVYCECTRGADKMQIAAAFTAGDSDQLIVGRNGVFYDRQGRDWRATIVRMLDNPISLKQAFWFPYKQAGRLMGEQIAKIAANKAKSSQDGVASVVTQASTKIDVAVPHGKTHPPHHPAPAQPFDAGRFAGIFAAIGLAVGALGTAIASIISGLLALHWWQLPLAIAGVMLIISGPSVVMAWFKLRSRNLGPILDANGWAINARARINIPFGTALTRVAQLPADAQRSLTDPYAEKPSKWPWVVGVSILAGAAIAVWWLMKHGH
ncbi:hypothetical protein KSF73_06690 [Burkholderiaceae bacterium DAT-1]|nr:hypothetical protein [Burkholderiaceae bacterium DAT-1]